ncbi:sporulation protein YunB [Clostridium tarantellae]|uniref:Sporulation protein YunB n=1 Tax=Clostridium tarantellae TaxID=39493 RepID=A0A6I1MLM1_9CLOT|nr:sporulation protein YunB [Clostridium tarantellae]MPQ43017.1 sporulation protein YunB [Clostridium tarantellae]
MYYRKISNNKEKIQFKLIKRIFIIATITIIIALISFIYYFDKVVSPTVMLVADSEMRAKTIEIINKNIANVYEKKFDYEDIIEIDKDNKGNITMIKADTVKLNTLATEVAIKSQQEIKEVGSIGVKIPIGYITKNNIMSYFGPTITVKMEPIGRVDVSYDSTFESAGINQTRHKIYIVVKTDLKIILPLDSREVQVKNEIPVSETIIVGEIPRTSLGSDIFENK